MFQNRQEAGRLLADSSELGKYKGRGDVVVLSIPRGGVVIGSEIARILKVSLSAIVVKKLGAPGNPELAIGAVAPDNIKEIDWELALRKGVEQDYFDNELKKKKQEIDRREKMYRLRDIKFLIKDKKTVILTDDGVATGATVFAAIKYIRNLKKALDLQSLQIILAIPVMAKNTLERLKSETDGVITLEVPESFGAVGEFYSEFPQVSDAQVLNILKSFR